MKAKANSVDRPRQFKAIYFLLYCLLIFNGGLALLSVISGAGSLAFVFSALSVIIGVIIALVHGLEHS